MKVIYALVATKFRGQRAIEIVRSLKHGDPVTLMREPENPHDPNAVAVWAQDHHCGFVPAAQSKKLAPFIDANGAPPLEGQTGCTFNARFVVTADRHPMIEVEQ